MNKGKQEIVKEVQELHKASLNYAEKNQVKQAIDKQKLILDLLEKINDETTEIIVRYNIGAFYYKLGFYEAALKEFEISNRIAIKKSNKKGEINSLIMISDIKSLWGRLEEAMNMLLYLLSILNNTDDQIFSCEINFRLASVSSKIGNYEEAHRRYGIAKQIAENNNFIEFKFKIVNNLGFLFYEWKDFDSARAYYDEALEFGRTKKNYEQEAMILNNIGLVYQAEGDYAKAIEFYNDSLSILYKIGLHEREKAYTLNNLGLVFFELEQYDKAMEKYNLSLSIHKKLGNISGERTVLHNIGNLHFKQKSFDKAEKYLERAFDKGKSHNNIKNAHTLSSLGLVFLEKNQISEAKKFLIQSFHLRDQIMASAPNEDVRIEARKKLFKILPILIQIFLREDNVFEALAYIEHSKGRELSTVSSTSINHYLPEIKNILEQKNINIEKIQINKQNLLTLESELKHKIISEGRFIKQSKEIDIQINKLEAENKNLDLNLWEKYPEYGVAIPSEPSVFLNQFLGDIPERTIVLDFFYDVYSNRIFVFSLSKDKEISIYQKKLSIDNVDKLKKTTESIRLLQRETNAETSYKTEKLLNELGTDLFNYLIPKDLYLHIKEYEPEFLTLIPNSFLHSLPLELIHDDEDYWGTKYNFSRAYSISNLKEFYLDSSYSAILIGNPDSSLKFAEEEILEIDELLVQSDFDTKKFLKKDARLSNITNHLKNHDCSFFHFSGHAEFNKAFPNLSCFYILDDELNIKTFYGNEIPLNIVFRKPVLVILNACETGTMSVSIGDEINGLIRGFVQAGAKGIILNTWSVFDISSADLLKEFYKILLEGNTISYSLRMARKHIRRKSKNSDYGSKFGNILHWGSCIYYGNPTIKIKK